MNGPVFFFFTLIVSITYFGESSSHLRVIGGQTAAAGQFPWAAAIYVQTQSSRFFCGGALVTSTYILTSGHCVDNATLFTIHLGSNKLTEDDSNRVTLASSEYILHPEFDSSRIENDLGLIKLRMAISLNTYINVINLPGFELYNNTGVTVIGWGQTNDYDPELSESLQYVYTTVLSNAECKMFYGSQLSDTMVCVSGDYNQGSCTGDNGGPLVEYIGRYPRVSGVASFVSGNGCESTDPSGYTRTWPYYEWLANVTSS